MAFIPHYFKISWYGHHYSQIPQWYVNGYFGVILVANYHILVTGTSSSDQQPPVDIGKGPKTKKRESMVWPYSADPAPPYLTLTMVFYSWS